MYDTLKSLKICSICGSSPRQKWCYAFSLPTTKAYVEFIGRKKARAHLKYIYCKVKQWIQREMSRTIKSRCARVWNIWWVYMVAILILLCSLKTYLLFETWKQFCKKTWAILFISFSLFFPGGHLSTHCFRYLGHLSIFSHHFFFFLWITFA